MTKGIALTRKSLIQEAGETRARVGQLNAAIAQVQQSGAQLLPDWPRLAGDLGEPLVYWFQRDNCMRQLIELDELLKTLNDERNVLLRGANTITKPSNAASDRTSTLRPNNSRLSVVSFEIEAAMRSRQDWQSKLGMLSEGHDEKVRRTDECLARIAALINATFRESVPQPSVPGSAKPPPKTSKPTNREKVIFGAIQARLKGLKYCCQLDSGGLHTPIPWQSEGCPPKYSTAYKQDAKWRKRIQDEKSRFKVKYVKLSYIERESIVQGSSPTRASRN